MVAEPRQQAAPQAWQAIVERTLANAVKLVAYVPDRSDGSPLMQLGCLSSIAGLGPSNLTLIVMDNGIYQMTGRQPTPAAARSDVVAIAQGCGLAASARAVDEEDFAGRSAAALAAAKPTLIAVRIDDSPGVGKPVRDSAIRERFMRGIGVRA